MPGEKMRIQKTQTGKQQQKLREKGRIVVSEGRQKQKAGRTEKNMHINVQT